MKLFGQPLQSAAITDVAFLVSLAPSSMAPISIAELHLYAYLANIVALSKGLPVSDWGYAFSLTTEGFPFSHELDVARKHLCRRSIIQEEDYLLLPDKDLLDSETNVLDRLTQSVRRKEWLGDALVCALHLPRGSVRDAINHSPGVAKSLRDRKASALLRDADTHEIYNELSLINDLLGSHQIDSVQSIVIWLSARIILEV